jgi:hypothetical protein
LLPELINKINRYGRKICQKSYLHGAFWNIPLEWLENVIREYKKDAHAASPPQLAIASWIAAGYCVNVMYNLVTGKEVKTFPKFYLSSVYNS